MPLKAMALPSEALHCNDINDLAQGLGKLGCIEAEGVSGTSPKLSGLRRLASAVATTVYDATSRLMELRFVASESTFAYFEALKAYLRRHGKPVAFYSDKHSIFRVSNENAASGNGMTQFGRALSELNIEILCANTSQAKGRVERAHHTLQDRLVKELRLAGISTIDAANGPRQDLDHVGVSSVRCRTNWW
jgi:hypothetical protein